MSRRADIAGRLPFVLGLRIPEAAAAVAVSEAHFRTMIERGRMPRPRDVGGVPVIGVKELEAAFQSLPYQGDATPPDSGAPHDDVVM